MKIVYLNAEDSANLEFDSPTGLTGNSKDKGIDGETNKLKAIVAHPNKEVYSLTDFALAFNDEFISDLGLIAIVDDNNNLIIY